MAEISSPRRRAIVLFLVSLASLAFAQAGVAASGDPYVESLVVSARARRLFMEEEWLRLGHYRRGMFGGYTSEADGMPFFLAADGKTDPEAELLTTLRAFFAEPSPDLDVQHAICKFPARFMWLNQELHFDRTHLPRVDCRAFREFVTALDPESVTLVFSSYFLNNPASSFGHTFLRVNKRGRYGAGHNDLLDYGVDYSANVDTSNPVLYALKGLFGLFPGTFHRMPYYLKVREYNDYDSRDLWEYDLALRPAEVAMFVAHLWELGSTYFAYYYLSENCSYHVLGALEAASPRLNLLKPLGWPVIPAETVKVLFRTPGLVRSIHYRPSGQTKFRARLRELSAQETLALGDLFSDANAKLDASFTQEQRVRVLDAALDLADTSFADQLLKGDKERDRDVATYKQTLLERRADEDVTSEDFTIAPPVRSMPHMAHGSRRVGLGPGYSTREGYYQAFKLRLALHDIADPAEGYPDTAEIQFLPVTLRYYERDPRLTVEDASLIRLLSLSPWDEFSKKLSWSVNVGASRIRDAGCGSCLAGQLDVGGGVTVSAFNHGAMLYLLGNAQIDGLSPIHDGLGHLPLRVGLGPSSGLRLRFTDDLIAVARAEWLYLPLQEPKYTWLGQAAIRWQYVKNFALSVEGGYQPGAKSVQALSYIYF